MTIHLTQTKPPVLSVVLPVFSVVLPVFNERESLAELHRRLSSVMIALAEPYEIIYVDDGSRDGSGDLLAAIQQNDAQVRVLHLSRNFGHQAAISAGLDHASGDAVIVLDADLQDPPEVLPALLAQWRLGFDVVYAVRRERKENLFKRSAYDIFYRLLRQVANVEIPLDAGDFCVLDRRVADVLRKMPERNRFMRGIRSWIGFRQIGVPYNRAPGFRWLLLLLLPAAAPRFSVWPARLVPGFSTLRVDGLQTLHPARVPLRLCHHRRGRDVPGRHPIDRPRRHRRICRSHLR